MGLLAPDTIFAGHRIEAMVGRGGMGVVYRARQLELDRLVALKVIAPELLDDPQIRERFVREARTAARIEHPNVIPLHYAGEEDGIAYIAMRYVDGDDVRTLVREHGVLAPERAAAIVAQAAAALDAIHAEAFVHRDVKPANLLLAAGDHVYLTDFGLMKHVRSRSGATRTGHWVGTLDYVAPEQIRGGRVDARADVYALGGVLHYMLTGHVPFDRESDEAKMWAHISDPPPLPSRLRQGLPVELDAVVERAMAKDPDARQPSAGDLGRAAFAAARGQTSAQPERMVARGNASPEGAAGQPGLVDDVPTLTGARPAGGATVRDDDQEPRRRRSPRRALVLAGVSVVVTAAIVAAVVATRPGSDTRKPPATGTSPKASAPRVGATIESVGKRPNGIAVAGRDAWVTSYGLGRLTRIDVATGRTRAQRPRVGQGALDIAASPGAVWVAVTPQHTVVRVDPRTGRVTDRLRTPLRPVALAADADSLWVVGRAAVKGDPDALLHYDLGGHLVRRVDISHGVGAIALGGGALWAAELRSSRVLRVNTRTGRVRTWAPIDVPGFALAYGSGYLWVSERDENAIARIDPRTGAPVTTAIGHQPAGVAVAGGRVFLASTTDHTVIVIDPRTVRPTGKPLEVALNPYAVTAGLGHVWVTSIGADSVTRIDAG
jgi:DNA-binding beta-propeller fold protein YncE